MSISKVNVSGAEHQIVGSPRYATCSTAAATAAKVATIADGSSTFVLEKGARICVSFTYANTASAATLNVASTGAKAICWNGSALVSSQYWQAGAVVDFVYDGNGWSIVGVAVDISDKVSKSGDTMTGKLTVPQVETGADNSNFFQCRKFRGEGDANTYYHAIDFGYQNHDQVDFHEYGGKWNFYKNTSGKANEGSLCGKITTNGWEGRAKLQSGSTMVTSQLTENSDAIATTAFVHGLIDKLSSAPVTSVNNKTGAVTLAKGDVGLGNVDNTSDANKPISNATQAALNDKQSKITANGFLKGDGTGGITADKPVFYITLRQNSSTKTYYADKTFSQILAAYDSGYEVKAIHGDGLFSLVQFNRFSNMYYFINISNNAIYTFLGRKSSGVEEWTYSTKGLVTESRTINNKPLSSDITLTPSDINAQSKITANGILKGDGTGTITAADETEVELVDLPQEVFWATYGQTTYNEVKTAIDGGKDVKLKFNDSGEVYNYAGDIGSGMYYTFCSITPFGIGGSNGQYRNALLSESNAWVKNTVGSIVDVKSKISLPAASWTGSDPYTQIVTIDNSTANTKVDLQPSEKIYDQLVADNVGYLAIKNVNGTLTAVAKGGKPSVDLTVQVTYNNVY